jgi:molybdopterin-guanine dinucleotide biosynthesis protein A
MEYSMRCFERFGEMKTIAVILSGGMSRRMGQDKATLTMGREGMLSGLVHRYSRCFDDVWVSVNEHGRFDTAGAGELVDHRPGEGPLAGLETAFLDTDAEVVFLTATDIPFGDPSLAKKLADACVNSDVCLLTEQEPLFGAYRRTCLPVISALLNKEERRMKGLFETVRVKTLDASEPVLERLMNVNDPETYRKALERMDWLFGQVDLK